MDPSAYKNVTTSRGLNYHYYFSQPHLGKPTLLLLHGFPSSSYDWHHQVAFFRERGYGLIVPDLLGYGGTDKPLDADAYRMKLMSGDLADILDKENVPRAIVIGHDWGSSLAGRFTNYYPARVSALALLVVGYHPPSTKFDIAEANTTFEKMFGYQPFGYWLFFSEDGADRIVEDHIDSFFSILYTADSNQWKTNLCPNGALKEWLQSDRHTARATYMSDEELNMQKERLLKDGFAAPFCWYKAYVNDLNSADQGSFSPETVKIEQPVFFGAALKDYVSVSVTPVSKAIIQQLCPKATIVDFDADHWVQLAAPHEVNVALLKWIEDLESPRSTL